MLFQTAQIQLFTIYSSLCQFLLWYIFQNFLGKHNELPSSLAHLHCCLFLYIFSLQINHKHFRSILHTYNKVLKRTTPQEKCLKTNCRYKGPPPMFQTYLQNPCSLVRDYTCHYELGLFIFCTILTPQIYRFLELAC